MKNNLFTRNNTLNRTRAYVGTVKVTKTNMARLRAFRDTLLSTTGQKVHLHGRHPNRKALSRRTGLSHRALRQDVPIHLSKSVDVYWR